MRIAIDTNTYRAFVDGDKSAARVVRQSELIGLPIPVLGELRYGFLNGTKGLKNEASLIKFMDSPRVSLLTCDEQTSHHYSLLKLQLKKQGTPIPINDVWIAALAIQHSLVLYTFDEDFTSIPQLPTLR